MGLVLRDDGPSSRSSFFVERVGLPRLIEGGFPLTMTFVFLRSFSMIVTGGANPSFFTLFTVKIGDFIGAAFNKAAAYDFPAGNPAGVSFIVGGDLPTSTFPTLFLSTTGRGVSLASGKSSKYR